MNCNRKTARDGLAAAWLKATQNSSPAAGYIYIHHERSGVCIKTAPSLQGEARRSEPSAARQPHPFPRFPIYIHPERSGVCKNCPLPRWEKVGVGAANHPQRDNFTRSHASLFTYTPSAQVYVKTAPSPGGRRSGWGQRTIRSATTSPVPTLPYSHTPLYSTK